MENLHPHIGWIIWIGIGLAAVWIGLVLDYLDRALVRHFTRWLTQKITLFF